MADDDKKQDGEGGTAEKPKRKKAARRRKKATARKVPDFTDGKSHVVEKAGKPVLTPSLRNLGKRQVDLRGALQKKLDASRQKTSGKAESISDEYSAMHLSETDISQLIAFLKLLNDVPDERFRELIIKATVLDTTAATE